jgi:site-specific recombinase XerD
MQFQRILSRNVPNVDSSFVFLSQQAPFKPLAGHSACYKIIQKVFKYAEIDIGAGVIGTRLLRHNAASKMLSKDISIQTISSMLGHTDVESTNVYLTTDELKMRECVLPLTSIPMGLEVLK